MLRNFIAVAIRHFLRQRLYSAINIIGLSAGLVCVMMIYLWVSDEVQKDKFHNDGDRIFQVISNLDFGQNELITWPVTPGPLADDIRDNVPGVESVARINEGGGLFQFGQKNFIEKGIHADPEFFSVFSFRILKGSKKPIGQDKSSIAISEKMASRFFGNDDPIGKVIRVSKKYDVEVKAVFESPGTHSSMQFDYVLPFEIYREARGDGFSWGNYDHPLYLKLTDASKVNEVSKLINERLADRYRQEGEKPDRSNFYLQPFTERYLHGTFENGIPVGGRVKYVQLFTIVGVFILVIACINFMNMATARAASRAKEVGVRKVIGAQRSSLIGQFILESMAISFIALILACGIVYTLLPLFNTLIHKNISLDLTDPGFIVASLAIVIVTGVLAGSYPAFFLSAYKPAAVLKGNTISHASGTLRKGLVIFQFSLTVILGASAFVIYQQIEYVRNKNIGYNRNGVITFGLRGNIATSYSEFANESEKIPGVKMVSRADNSLVQVDNQNASVWWPGKPDNTDIFFRTVCVDYDFLELMELTLKEGRLFSKEFADTNNIVLTQSAVDVMGLQHPVGQKIKQWGREGTVIGVVEDFHSRSLQQAIDPVVFLHLPQYTGRVVVRFDTDKTTEVVEGLTALSKKFDPEFPFTYSFLDDDFENLYNNEKVISSLAVVFTAMTIIISGLGLLGLAAYTAEQRKKEVGIRKILGASVPDIVGKMSGEFIKLSIMATVIGCPLAYFFMREYLASYQYHQELSWDVFIITGVAVILMSVITVIYQVTKAALANPVDALRNE